MIRFLTAFLALFALSAPAYAAPVIGEPAPAFTGTDTNGVEHALSDYLGKTVVLEWTNHECPFVKKHYGSGNMQALQKQATDEGVIWLSIVSSAPGKQGNVTGEQANEIMAEVDAHATARILDPDGTIGHLYDAKTTPHMFVIDAEGTLVYAGAIDDQPTPRPETIEGAHNYVRAALDNLAAGTAVEVSQTQAYGCGVKY
ncbi:MAG: redoxin domain-containing protein [Rhodospirillales bacterium]|nr:redoxin domain-containing protein [Rhodospirillales bacterium]